MPCLAQKSRSCRTWKCRRRRCATSAGHHARPRIEGGVLESVDEVDVSVLMRCRAVVMKFPQKFLRWAFRSVIRFASQEANAASMARDERRQCRVEIVPLDPSDGVEGGDSQEPSSRELRPVHAWGVGRSLLARQQASCEEAWESKCRALILWAKGRASAGAGGDQGNFFQSVSLGSRPNRTWQRSHVEIFVGRVPKAKSLAGTPPRARDEPPARYLIRVGQRPFLEEP